MNREEQIKIHSARAMTELDRALEATCFPAARAHFGLSALHLDRVRELARGAACRESVVQH